MIVSPVIIRYNKRIARLVLREHGPPATAIEREQAATTELARREHVIVCGFGRVGGHLAHVLDSQGFEYLAIDLDPANVRSARQAGVPVVWGDCADEELLRNLGLDLATVVIITFADPAVALHAIRAVRRLRADVPVLVRTQDDSRLAELSAAGATEVVPETFEASLTLVSQALTLLQLPAAAGRARGRCAAPAALCDAAHAVAGRPGSTRMPRNAPTSCAPWCCLPAAGRWGGGWRKSGRAAPKSHSPRSAARALPGANLTGETELREGDVVVIYGIPEALEHAEAVLLAG